MDRVTATIRLGALLLLGATARFGARRMSFRRARPGCGRSI